MPALHTAPDIQESAPQETGTLTSAQVPVDKVRRYAIEYLPDPESTGLQEQLSALPSRFTAFIYSRNGLPLKTGLMVLVFITALYTKKYTGEYQQLVNNHLGGLLYVLFGSLALSVLLPRVKPYMPVAMATGITCLLELVQKFHFPFMTDLTRFKPFAYLFGNSYNPADFLYYAAGALVALLVIWLLHED